MSNEIRMLENELFGTGIIGADPAKQSNLSFGLNTGAEALNRIIEEATKKKDAPVKPTVPTTPAIAPKTPSFLTQKMGPLPVYGWGLVGVGALVTVVTVVKLSHKKGRR